VQVLCLILLLSSAEVSDFELGVRAYNKEQYSVAKAYFETVLAQDPHTEYRADILYYLVGIHTEARDIPAVLLVGSQFLSDYPHDKRSESILSALVQELTWKQSFGLIAEYIRKYDYLIMDQTMIEKTAGELIARKQFAMAESLLHLCVPNDTVKLMLASATEDLSERQALYASVSGEKGKMYLMDFYLGQGDTLSAFEVFRGVHDDDVDDALLFRYACVSRLFDKESFIRAVGRMERNTQLRNKARLLRALETGQLDVLAPPLDAAESSLLFLYTRRDTVSRRPPEQVSIESVLTDSCTRTDINRVRRGIHNYFLDSLYADMLLREGRTGDADDVVKRYFAYQNTVRFARRVHALYLYQRGAYDHAACNIILSRTRAPQWVYLLANSFKFLGRKADYLYRDVVSTSTDSALVDRAQRELMRIDFDMGAYDAVCAYGFETAQNDTQLIVLYAYSLARTGKYSDALSVLKQYSEDDSYSLNNYYGEYLIEKKKYSAARTHYDSIVVGANGRLPAPLVYNWALIPFLQGNVDTAMVRFQYYRKIAPRSKEFHQALFKIATLYYAQQEFDSAAYYYGLASEDDYLRADALLNQLVCFKKSSRWTDIINVSTLLLGHVPDEEKHTIAFELGYAYLRLGRVRQAVDFLKIAVTLRPTPEYHYWLAETYLGKGDFVRALYHYQKVVNAFAEDEMWTPTAQYKTGIVLEFLDEPDEARTVYEQIVRERGHSDTWGSEAQKRIDELEKSKR
jgi:TolA-binding protein